MAVRVNINGVLVAPEEARISVFDHGFLYGDSVYETVRAYGGACFLLDQHLARLEHSAALLALVLPVTGPDLRHEIERTVAAAANVESAVRITVTRGVGPIGIDPGRTGTPTVVIVARPLESLPAEAYARGVQVIVSQTVRNSPRALDPSIKSGNFLNNILARREAAAVGAFEAVMLNQDGFVAEASQSNIFTVVGGQLRTPGAGGFLRGITRDLVLMLAREAEIPAVETDVYVTELYEASEVFLTSTLKGIVPACAIGSRTVGTGVAPVTRRLMQLYSDYVQRFLAATPSAERA